MVNKFWLRGAAILGTQMIASCNNYVEGNCMKNEQEGFENMKIEEEAFMKSQHDIEEETFYIFGVGQGNAQLAVYKGKYGVLYDCGSSSQRIHPKLCELKTNLTNENLWNPIFLRGKKNAKRTKPPIKSLSSKYHSEKRESQSLNEEYENEISDSGEGYQYSESSKFSFGEDSISNCSDSDKNDKNLSTYANTEKKNIKNFIKETILKSDLDHLFIILSHPDKDHINYIDSGVILEDMNITIFLEAQWLSRLNKEPVREVLKFLLKRNPCLTTIELPHYWNGLVGKRQSTLDSFFRESQPSQKKEAISYEQILKFLLEDVNNDKCDEEGIITFPVTQKNIISYEVNYQDSSLTTPLKAQSLEEYVKWRKCNELYKNYIEELGNVRIVHSWYYGKKFDIGNNFRTRNSEDETQDPTNLQSAVVEITMHQLKMHAFLTGDAEEKTLLRIRDENYFGTRLKKKFEKNKDFFSLVMLPHHGSYEKGEEKLRSDKKNILLGYFDADVFGISAGNGVQYGHPSHKLIKEIGRNTNALTFEHINQGIEEGDFQEGCNNVGENFYNSSFYDMFECADQVNSMLCFSKKKAYRIPSHAWSYARECIDNLANEESHEYCDEAGFPFICTNVMGSIKINHTGFYVPFINYAKDDEGRMYMIDYTKKAKYDSIKNNLYFLVTEGKVRSAESINSSQLRSGAPYKRLKGLVVFAKDDLINVNILDNHSNLVIQRSPDMLGDAVCKLVLGVNKEAVYYRAAIYDNRAAELKEQHDDDNLDRDEE